MRTRMDRPIGLDYVLVWFVGYVVARVLGTPIGPDRAGIVVTMLAIGSYLFCLDAYRRQRSAP